MTGYLSKPKVSWTYSQPAISLARTRAEFMGGNAECQRLAIALDRIRKQVGRAEAPDCFHVRMSDPGQKWRMENSGRVRADDCQGEANGS